LVDRQTSEEHTREASREFAGAGYLTGVDLMREQGVIAENLRRRSLVDYYPSSSEALFLLLQGHSREPIVER
jgi:hypothetical protein